MTGKQNEYPTYSQGRRCLHCKEPISDQAHASQKFCKRKVMPDGNVLSCKDDYHSALKRKSNLPYKRIGEAQKFFSGQIDLLKEQFGNEVTLTQINSFGINLRRPVEFSVENGDIVYHFVGHTIKKLKNNIYKIYSNDTIY